ncbi:MAG: 1,4-beta-xylanase [Bryobacteraceae bacterium]|jgi:hypothetical protein
MNSLRLTACLLLSLSAFAAEPVKWTPEAANLWYSKQPWMVGVNYVPASAINQIEMWNADTFDPVIIDTELGWAQAIGMNTVRVFLHEIPWLKDPGGCAKRIGAFLRIADKHKIRVLFVLFNSRWSPFPEPGIQQDARSGVHNSAWVQDPGAPALMDEEHWDRHLLYVEDVIHEFLADKRVVAWDLWSEPDNRNEGSYSAADPKNKAELAQRILPRLFKFARAAMPSQPLTSSLWQGDWSSPDKLSAVEKIQLEESDIVSFHNYDKPADFEKRLQWLQQYHRPVFCTEFLARDRDSTFQGILPIAKKYNAAAFSWGLVAGKTQTYLPLDSWQHPYTDRQPAVWHQDIFRDNGTPYSQEEIDFIRQITGRGGPAKAKGK